MSKKEIVIYGCGGHGRVIHDILLNMKDVHVVGFVDDNQQMSGSIINGSEVIGTSSVLKQLITDGVGAMALGIGNNHVRGKLYVKWQEAGFTMINVVHPGTIVSKNVRFGRGVVIMPGVVINTGSEIGDNTCINTGATIDHDNKLGDHVNIGPGATLTGGVAVGNYTDICANVTINPYLSVGFKTVVGSGTVVVSNIPDNVTVVGVPARIVSNTSREEVL